MQSYLKKYTGLFQIVQHITTTQKKQLIRIIIATKHLLKYNVVNGRQQGVYYIIKGKKIPTII